MTKESKRKAVFFDKDGVINELVYRGENLFIAGEKITNTAPWALDELHIYEEAKSIVRGVQERGYLAIIVTNQPDIRHGLMDPIALYAMLAKVRSLGFDDVFACLHNQADGCACRKPLPGMLYEAAKKWNVSLENSFMLGDMESDLQAGRTAGCTPILIGRPYNTHVVAENRISSLDELEAFL